MNFQASFKALIFLHQGLFCQMWFYYNLANFHAFDLFQFLHVIVLRQITHLVLSGLSDYQGSEQTQSIW